MSFVKSVLSQFTNREWRPRIRWRNMLMLLPVVVLVLAVTGPYGTFNDLTFIERLGYWSFCFIGVSVVMISAVLFIFTFDLLPHFTRVGRFAVAVVGGAVPGVGVVYGGEYLYGRSDSWGLTPAFAYVAVIAITLVIMVMTYRNFVFPEDAAVGAPGGDRPGGLFFRHLSRELGHELVSLSKQDHYLEVTTAAGRELILHRIADAAAELHDYPGLRIHRSHWAALSAMTGLERDGSSYRVVLSDGRRLPVSRPYLPEVRKALAGAEK